MRILLVQGAAHRGGAERILLALARHLPAHGIEPVVGFLAEGPFVEEVAQAGVETISLGSLPRARQLWRSRDMVDAIAAGAVAAGVTVLLANGEKLAPYTGWAARRAKAASIVWLHDAPLRSAPSAALQLAMRVSPHDAVVAGSAWMAEKFERAWRMRVRCIPHGIDLATLPSDAADLRGAAGWPAEAETVMLVARLQRWKGAEVFLRAAARIAGARPHARFAVVGGALYGWEEEYAAALPELARSLGIDDRVWFSGHREDALSLMAAADVVTHCSLKPEPLGLVVPEAMALGRGVVASTTRGPEELIEQGVTGLLVPPGDDRRLADAVLGLLASPEDRARLGTAASATVGERWSASTMTASFAQLIRQVGAR